MSNPAVIESESVALLRKEVAPVLQRAQAIVVKTADDRSEARAFVLAIKRAQEQAHKKFDVMVEKTHGAWKEALAVRASFLTPLEAAEKAVKTLITTYDQEQERIRLDEQRRLQAIADEAARKERHKIEQETERQRQIHREKEAIAAHARRKAEEAEGAERKRLLAEAEAAERKAAAAAAKVEVKEEQAAAIVAPVVTIAEPEKPKGESTSKLWRAKLTDKAALIQSAAQGNEIAATCLTFDQTAANTLATATKGAVLVPGMEWYTKPSLAMRVE
jgi:hypothetical protein